MGEAGELPLTIIAAIRMIRYWHRCTTVTVNCQEKLTPRQIQISSHNSSDWKSSIKHLLKLMSLENVYSNPQTDGVNQLNTLCKIKMRSIFTEFYSELNMADIESVKNSKFHTYKPFKNKFALKNYLIDKLNSERRELITKFRCSIHELMIENRRYKKIDVRERLCYICY